MEESADRFGLRGLVVKRNSMLRRQDMHRDLAFLQKVQRLARHVKALGHSKPLSIRFRAKCFGEW